MIESVLCTDGDYLGVASGVDDSAAYEKVVRRAERPKIEGKAG
jgi:hypothetical protein